jgi:tetratricopeptide (TPR) repeat protein
MSLELVHPVEGVTLWAGEYSSDMKNIFAVLTRIAEDVARALRVKLRPTAVSARMTARVTEPRAYRAYLHGRQAAADSHLDEAIGFFDEAIAADPGLPEAFAGKVEALHAQVTFGDHQDDPGRRQQLRIAADRAHLLDPDLPQANLAMSFGAESLAESLKYLRHAIDADPSYGEGYGHIGDEIQDFDPERATVFYRRSLELDPRLQMSRTHLASTLLALNRWEDARQALEPPQSSGESDAATAVQAMIDVDERHFDRALDRLHAATRLRTSPLLSAVHVVALRTAERTDEAFDEATQMAARLRPLSCENRGLVAGLRLEQGQNRPAHQLADPNLRDARSDTASPAAIRCGVVTAAAMNDASRVAALLTRIASREDLLRFWARDVRGGRGSLYLRGRMYPWTNIADKPSIAAARERLNEAYTLARDEARKVLDGLPQQ